MTFRTAAWYYDIKNFINDNGITAPGTGLGSNCLYNIDSFKLYGLEMEATIRPIPEFRATLGYVYQHHDVKDNMSLEEDWVYYLPGLLPRHKIKLLSQYNVWKGGWFQLGSRYVHKREAQKGTTLDAYITVDLGLEQTFEWQGMKYSVKAFVSNVTGTNYQEQSGYEMPKQIWGFQLGAKF